MIKILKTITEFYHKEVWDSMIGDNVFASYGWLKTVEDTYRGDITPIYFLKEENDELIGAAVCYFIGKSENTMGLDDFMFGRLKKMASWLGLSFLPSLSCCPLKSHGIHFLLKQGISPKIKREVMAELIDSIQNTASQLGWAIDFRNIMDHETELIDLLSARGYHRTLGAPLNHLEIVWSSFEEYVKSLKAVSNNIGGVIRREMNKNGKQGVLIKEMENIGECEERLYELANMNFLHHNGKPFPFQKGIFRKLKGNLGEDAIILVSMKSGIMTGMCVFLRKGVTGYIPFVGIDHKNSGNDFTYFNLTYYTPIQSAISEKMKQLVLGIAMYEIKARRGCVIKRVHHFYKSTDPIKDLMIRPWVWIHSAWWKRKVTWASRNARWADKTAHSGSK